MNAHSWLKIAKTKIANLDAELILAHILHQERIFLHTHPETELTKRQISAANKLLARRQNHEPLAYILGYKEFYGRNFQVNKNVLIPRPESETIIELTKQIQPTPKNIADIGTGSGCIAITLALELTNTHIVATDICKKALNLAAKNATNLSAQNITFIQSDLLTKLPDHKFDLICANLPYVDQLWAWNSPELIYEPKKALYASNNGLQLIFKLIESAPKYLNQHGQLILESDHTQHPAIKKYAQSHNFEHISTSGIILAFRIGS